MGGYNPIQTSVLRRPEKDLLGDFGRRSLNCPSTHLNFGSLNFVTIARGLEAIAKV